MLLDLSYKAVIEGILFISDAPVTVSYLSDILDIDKKTVAEILSMLEKDYSNENKGFILRKVCGGYMFFSNPIIEPYLDKLSYEKKAKLTSATYEVLSIIAYRQPVTRSQIESIRGVKSDGAIQTLMLRGLVEEKGRLEQPGRPIIFGTTDSFAIEFGLNDIKDLPRYQECQDFDFTVQEESVEEANTETQNEF